jgi:hypothetical protein
MAKTFVLGNKIFIVVAFMGFCLFSACGKNNAFNLPDPEPAVSKSDFMGRWRNDDSSCIINITNGRFALDFTSIYAWRSCSFEMSITSWEKVPCEVSLWGGAPWLEFTESISLSYKITGSVVKNINLNDNGYQREGYTQNLYLHLRFLGGSFLFSPLRTEVDLIEFYQITSQ